MDREAGESIQGIKEEFYRGADASGTRFRQKNEDGGRCIRLCDGGSIIDGIWGWVVKTSSISFQVTE